MFKFFSNSVRELKHVVWPTRKETTNYLTIVVTILILLGIYLFLASTIFSEAIIYLKNNVMN
ncbi:MAG: preprotein translocase subunit SecE [Candidatus Peribacteria bacterium]|nr:preprotein translocase subunit SecE [Candidatus Peribacteria bacterium]